MAIDQETRERAEQLYVIDGLSLEETAKETGINERTIQNWSVSDDWKSKRKRYRDSVADIKRNSIALKQELISKALNTLKLMESIDPQDMHGFRSVLAAADIKEKEPEKDTAIDRPRLFLEDMEFVAETLKEIDPEGLKILARNFDVIVRRFKERHAKAA